MENVILNRKKCFLVREGLLTQDAENSYLALESEDDASPLPGLQQHSITNRIAVGPQQGRKVFTLQMLPAHDGPTPITPVGKAAGFSLHAGVVTAAHQSHKLEQVCRYVARPAISEKRLALTRSGQVRYALKTPYIACIETPQVIDAILTHLAKKEQKQLSHHAARAPPEPALRDHRQLTIHSNKTGIS